MMSNPSKRTGTGWESDVEAFLNESDLEAKRTGSADFELGDIHFGLSDREWTIEAKAEQTIDLPGYLKQLYAAVGRRGVSLPFKSAVAVKNRRHSVGDGYAVMELRQFRSLVVYVALLEFMLQAVTGVSPEGVAQIALANDSAGLLSGGKPADAGQLAEPLAEWERELLEGGKAADVA
jgi:hypothetical protein